MSASMKEDMVDKCAAGVIDVYRLILRFTDCGDCTPEAVNTESVAYLKEKLEALTPGECEMTNLAMDILGMALGSECSATVDVPVVQLSGR